MQSDQHIIQQSIVLFDYFRTHRVEVVVYWIPVHIKMEGNEKVDKLAKEAAE